MDRKADKGISSAHIHRVTKRVVVSIVFAKLMEHQYINCGKHCTQALFSFFKKKKKNFKIFQLCLNLESSV
jgi:hypothetical protein